MDHSVKRSIPEDGLPEAADPIFPYGSDGLCCCFAPMYLRRNSISTPAEWWGQIPADGGVIGAGVTSGWWNRGVGALMKIREWSELVAGPRWKTFIRRFNRNPRCSRMAQRFQYDPFSYALNFDDGFGGSGSPVNDTRLGELSSSSSRYAITPPAKPRMEIKIRRISQLTARCTDRPWIGKIIQSGAWARQFVQTPIAERPVDTAFHVGSPSPAPPFFARPGPRPAQML